jgi:chorismate mutase
MRTSAALLLMLGLVSGDVLLGQDALPVLAAEAPGTPPAAATPAQKEYGDGNWAEPEATHRLEYGSSGAGDVRFIDLACLHLPASLDGGVSVRAADGAVLAYDYQPGEKALFVAAPPTAARLHVYFGFPPAQPRARSTWDAARSGEPPTPRRLELTLVRAWMANDDETTVHARRDYQRHLRGKLATAAISAEDDAEAMLDGELTEAVEARVALEKEIGSAKNETKADMTRQLQHLQERERVVRERLRTLREQAERDADSAHRQALAEAARWREEMTRQEREIERFFLTPEAIRSQSIGTVSVRKALLVDNPVNEQRNFAARLAGRLRIARAGCYTFAINSRNGSHLVVDNRLVVAWPNGHPPSNGWEKTGEIYLDPGIHDFAFYYQTNTAPAYAAAAWRRPDDAHFSLLTQDDFSPAGETVLLGCADAGGNPLPVVRADPRGWFLMGDESRAGWVDCTLLPETWDRPFAWRVDGQSLDSARAPAFVLPMAADNTVAVTLTATTDGFPDLPVTVGIDPAERHRHDPSLGMKLWTPSFLYDDERLQMDVEVVSELTEDCRVRLCLETDRPHPLFPPRDEWLDMPGRNTFAVSKYAPSYVWKRPVVLPGRELADGLELTYRMELPPLIVHGQTLRFTPLPALPDVLRETPDGLVDAAGRRVIPLLHRLTLSEKRSWAFSKALATELAPCRKLIVVADDFGDPNPLSKLLRERVARRGVELVFLPWPTPPTGGTAIRAGVAELLPLLRRTDADRVLLLPPSTDLVDGIPVRLQKRALAAMIETCHRNPKVRTLILGTPFPSRRDNTLEPELVRAVYELATEYGTGSLDLNRWLRTRPGWESAYRRNLASAAVYEPLPVQWVNEIAKRLADNLF